MNRIVESIKYVLVKTKPHYIKNIAKHFSTKQLDVDIKLTPKKKDSDDKIVLDNATVQLLERLALVNFGSKKSKEILEDAIKFADKIHEVNVDNVKPLVNVLEADWSTPQRDDVIEMDNTMQDVMLNAKHIEEDYFVAPPSNVPLCQGEDGAEKK